MLRFSLLNNTGRTALSLASSRLHPALSRSFCLSDRTPQPIPTPEGLSDDQLAGRDLAKLAKLTTVMRDAIRKSARNEKQPRDNLLEMERPVNAANQLITNALDRMGKPCTVEELAHRINSNILEVPREAMDFREHLDAQELRDDIEGILVALQVLPPPDTWIEGSGKAFSRHDRKRFKKEAEMRAAGLIPSEGQGENGEILAVDENEVLKELRPVSKQELEKRKAYLENSTSMEEVLKGYETALLKVGRVHKVVKEGTTMSLKALVVIGDRKGTAGYGEGKSDTPQHAIERACRDAKRNLLHIELHRGRTIYHRAKGKFVKSQVSLWPAPPGTGISANNHFSTVLQLFGLKDVGAKLHGPRSLSNAVKALFNALSNIETPERVARARGLSEIVKPQLPKDASNRRLRAL